MAALLSAIQCCTHALLSKVNHSYHGDILYYVEVNHVEILFILFCFTCASIKKKRKCLCMTFAPYISQLGKTPPEKSQPILTGNCLIQLSTASIAVIYRQTHNLHPTCYGALFLKCKLIKY